jgi:hypothetical protein
MKSVAIIALFAPLCSAIPVPTGQGIQSLAAVKTSAAYENTNLENELKLFHQVDGLPSDDDEEENDDDDSLVMRDEGTEFTKIQDKENSASSASDDDKFVKGYAGALAQAGTGEVDKNEQDDEEMNEVLDEDDEDAGHVQNTRGGVVGLAEEEEDGELEDLLNDDDEGQDDEEEDAGHVQNTRGGVVGLTQQKNAVANDEVDDEEDKEDLDEVLDEEESDSDQQNIPKKNEQ